MVPDRQVLCITIAGMAVAHRGAGRVRGTSAFNRSGRPALHEDVMPTAWQIRCDSATLDRLRPTRVFQRVIVLARIVNAIRFVQIAAHMAKDDDSPSGTRQVFNSFFYYSALLFEGFSIVRRLGQDLRHLEAFQRGFAPLLADRATDRLLERLRPLRNQAAFHFDESVVARLLDTGLIGDIPFAAGAGETVGGTYYHLADFMAIRLLAPTSDSEVQFLAEYGETMRQVTALAGRFLIGAERLIAEYAAGEGFTISSTDNGA